MAEVARSHGVDVVVSAFEEWTPGRTFDLVCSGQAWHWIDPEMGYRRAAELLRPGGRLAVFWNSYRYDEATTRVIDEVCTRVAPHLLIDSVAFGTLNLDYAMKDVDAIRQSKTSFDDFEFRVFSQPAHAEHRSVDCRVADALARCGPGRPDPVPAPRRPATGTRCPRRRHLRQPRDARHPRTPRMSASLLAPRHALRVVGHSQSS